MHFLEKIMLGRNNQQKNQTANAQGAGYTYIEKGTTIKGDLSSSGAMRCDGSVMGNINIKGNLELSAGATIEGESVECDNLILHGTIKANVIAKGKITITKSGKLYGDVKATALDIESGAVFSGRSEMNAQNSPAPEKSPEKSPEKIGRGAT
jgi:cytoskeletal protein CcmA (bactofilin family)